MTDAEFLEQKMNGLRLQFPTMSDDQLRTVAKGQLLRDAALGRGGALAKPREPDGVREEGSGAGDVSAPTSPPSLTIGGGGRQIRP
jgi:hypothetical protein